MIEYDTSGDITRVTHEHDADPVPAVAQQVIRHQLAGRTAHVREALAELPVPQLRQLAQACVALTSTISQLIVAIRIEDKRS